MRFPFAQFEVPGRLGIDDGRYLVRDAEGDAEDVLVFSSLEAPRRGRRRRPRRAPDAGEGPEAEALPATRITVVRASAFEDDGEAEAWLARMRGEAEARDAFAAAALKLVNESLHAHRAAAMDPYVNELGPHSPSVVRVGYGDGDELAAGNWSEAVEAPPDPGRRERRVDALRPQERLASVLGDRESVDPCETLVLRARLDFDHDRRREAALQLEIAVAALLAELAGAPADQAEDLATLREGGERLERIRERALGGELSGEDGEAVGEMLAVAERVLRRRRILGAG